jgi:nitronate monooxygenase
MRPDFRQALLDRVAARTTDVLTDPVASPTGFPFKVAALEGTLSDPEIYRARPRVCDLGYLREAYRTGDGDVGFRCPAEPVSAYVSKGGVEADTRGRKCICNALIATIGLGQRRSRTYVEPAIVTTGDDVDSLARFFRPGQSEYTAADVIHTLLAGHPG